MAIKDFYPAIRPTLDLNFAGSRIVDPRTAFSRSGTGNVASYFDEKGAMKFAPQNTPRIDFDPVTGECKGLLIEEQRTNLLTYSEQFDNATWDKANSTVTTNSTIAPDGSLTADILVENTNTGGHETSKAVTLVAGTTYALSIYAKASSRTRVRLAGRNSVGWSSFPNGVFDLLTGTVVNSTGAYSAVISDAGDGWYRCTVFGTTGATGAGMVVSLVQSGTTSAYTGDGTSGLYIWGAQIETGNAPSGYIPTTSAQVTRAGDILSLTGLNASSWYKQEEGTFLIEFTPYAELQSTVRILIGSNPGYIAYFIQQSTRLRTYDGTNITIADNGAVAGGKQKAVVTYSGSSVTLTMDGTNPVTGTFDGGYGADVYIGCLSSGSQLNGWIRRISYYPKSLQNANLMALTA